MPEIAEAVFYFFQNIAKQAFTYTVIIVIFSYHVIFDKDLLCTCQDLHRDCPFYMIAPACLILLALLYVDQPFQKSFFLTGYWSVALIRFFDAVIVALIWNVSVLVEGNWMVCCFDDSNRNISCKDKYHLTDNDKLFINVKKNYSRFIGLSLLLCVVLLAFVVSLWKKKKGSLQERVLFTEILCKKEKDRMTKQMETKAVKKLGQDTRLHTQELLVQIETEDE